MRAKTLCLVLLCTSCQTKEKCHFEAIKNHILEHDMARLFYPASSPTRGIELEIVRHGQEIYGYLNVHQFAFPTQDHSPKETEIRVNSTSFTVNRLEGGRRLSLSKSCLNTIIETLRAGESVSIAVAHFYQEIPPETFTNCIEKLLQKPFLYWPDEWIHFEI